MRSRTSPIYLHSLNGTAYLAFELPLGRIKSWFASIMTASYAGGPFVRTVGTRSFLRKRLTEIRQLNDLHLKFWPCRHATLHDRTKIYIGERTRFINAFRALA